MMENQQLPLVSVLVPLYNHERYIVNCLESIVADGYPNKEIVVLDDGSRDDSVGVALRWHEANRSRAPRFTLNSRPNKGVTKTLNELVSLASGRYLCLVASDDCLWPGGIEARYRYLADHPKHLAVFGDCAVVDDAGRVTAESVIQDYYGGRKSHLADERLLSYEIIFNWSIAGPSFMADRKAFDVVGGYDESLVVEDWDMYLRLAAKGILGFVDQRVAAYRVHGSNSILAPAQRLPQLRSLKRTAWQNAWSFSGIRRYRLLHHYFRQANDIAVAEGKAPTMGFVYLEKTLLRKTERRYQRLLRQLEKA